MSIRQEIVALSTTVKDLRNFGLLVGGVFAAFGAIAWWRDVSWAPVALWIGVPLIVLGAVLPRVLRPLYLAWMSLAIVLGLIVTTVILTVAFFLVFVPVALVFRLIGRDALHRKLDRDATSYWIPKEYLIADRSRFEKFF